MSLFRKSFINTGPKAPPQKKQERDDGRDRNKKIRKPRHQGEQKRHRLRPLVGEVKVESYRVVCRVTNDEGDVEFFHEPVSSLVYERRRFKENQDVGGMTKMSGPPQNRDGKTPFLVETEQFFGEEKFGINYRFCLIDYKIVDEEIERLSTLTENILWPAKLIQYLDYHKARLFNDISPELLMVSVQLFNQLLANDRILLANMFEKIYIVSFDIAYT